MLKSHFQIIPVDLDEEIVEEEHVPTVKTGEEGVYVDRKLHKQEISVRLSWLGKTAQGDGYTYLKATLTGMKLTNIRSIQLFKHLQFVDLSSNYLSIDALQAVTKLPFLVLLQADKNLLYSANLDRCKFLQVIIMNNNKLVSVEDVFQPELSTLEVGFNQILEIKFKNRMANLRVLDFRNNLISDIKHLDSPTIDSLYLAGNKLKSLIGIHRLPNLRILHVRNNPIKYLDGFETFMPKLEYLNLRNCKIGNFRQVKKLKEQLALKTLILKGTPFLGGSGKEQPKMYDELEDPDLRIKVLATLLGLHRLNKLVFTDEDREEAKDLMMQWLEEGQEAEEEEMEEELQEEAEEEEDSEETTEELDTFANVTD